MISHGLFQRIQRADGCAVEAAYDVRVDHGGFDALVAQVFLNLADVYTVPFEFTPPPVTLNERFWRNGIYGKGEKYPKYSHVYKLSGKIKLRPVSSQEPETTNNVQVEVGAEPQAVKIVGATTGNYSLSTLKVVNYKYDAKTHKGVFSVDMSGRDFQEARNWVVTNIGKICSDKELLLESGQETHTGGKYLVLNESTKDGILTIEFSAGYDE